MPSASGTVGLASEKTGDGGPQVVDVANLQPPNDQGAFRVNNGNQPV